MKPTLLLLLLASLTADQEVRDLVEELRSDRIEDRGRAESKLLSLGQAALPEVEKAGHLDDPEVATRARAIARRIEFRSRLTPNLKAAIPDLEEKLFSGRGSDLLGIALERNASGKRVHPKLGRRDLEVLAPWTLESARNAADIGKNLEAVKTWRLRSAEPTLLRLLSSPNPELRRSGTWGLGSLQAGDAIPSIRSLLLDPVTDVCESAGYVLEDMGAFEAAPEALALLASPDPRRRGMGVRLLSNFRIPVSVGPLLQCLGDTNPDVRWLAMKGLRNLRAGEVWPELARQFDDANVNNRRRSLRLLIELDMAEAYPLVVRLLGDPDSDLRGAAAQALRDWRSTDAIPEIRRLLGDPQPAIRRDALLLLGQLCVKPELSEVARFLEDSDPSVRAASLRTLAILKAYGYLPAVMKRLGDPAPTIRSAALEALRSIEGSAATSSIIPFLKDPDPGVRGKAASSLAEIGNRSVIPELLPLWKDPDPQVRISVYYSLVALQASEVIPELRSRLADRSGRGWAAEQLVRMDVAEAIPVLVGLLREDADWMNASLALKNCTNKAVIHPLVGMLADKDSLISARAADILLALHPKEAIPPLIEGYKRGGQGFRESAGRLFAELNAVEAIPVLLECFKDDGFKESFQLRDDAAVALQGLNGPVVLSALRPLLSSEDVRLRGLLAMTLARCDTKDATAELVGLVRDKSGLVRCEALRALKCRLTNDLLPAIAFCADDDDPYVRQELLWALWELKTKECIPAVRKLIRDPWDNTRENAASLLGFLQAREAIPDLRSLLDDEDHRVRAQAAEALAQLGVGEALPRVLDLLEDEDYLVREQALGAICSTDVRERNGAIFDLLHDPHPMVRAKALAAAGRFLLPEALPELRRALCRTRSDQERMAAVRSLCRLGQSEGVPILLYAGRGRPSLGSLNAIRKGEAWTKLIEFKSVPTIGETIHGFLNRAAAAVGLRIVEPAEDGINQALKDPVGFLIWNESDPTIPILEWVLHRRQLQLVVEEGCIRVLSYEEALREWRAWWKARRKDR